MTASFKRTATVEFALHGSDQSVTVSDLPYIWIPACNPCMDQEAVFAASDYLRSIGVDSGKTCVSVCTSPVK